MKSQLKNEQKKQLVNWTSQLISTTHNPILKKLQP
jgi:hypothetical protein